MKLLVKGSTVLKLENIAPVVVRIEKQALSKMISCWCLE